MIPPIFAKTPPLYGGPEKLYGTSTSSIIYPQIMAEFELSFHFENLHMENFAHLDSHLDSQEVELLFGLVSSLSAFSNMITCPSTLPSLIKDLQEKHPKMEIRHLVDSLQKIGLNIPRYRTIINAIKEALVARKIDRDRAIGETFLNTVVTSSIPSPAPAVAPAIPSPAAVPSISPSPSESKAPAFKMKLKGSSILFAHYGSFNFKRCNVYFSEDQIRQLIKSPSISEVTRGHEAELEGIVKFSELIETLKRIKNDSHTSLKCVVEGIGTLELPSETILRLQKSLQVELNKISNQMAYDRTHIRGLNSAMY